MADSTDGAATVPDLLSNQQTGSATVTATAPNIVTSVQSLGFSLVDDSGVENVDPLLGPLADNGGKTQTAAPLPGSPAVGAGAPAVCGAAPVGGVDQRGLERSDSACSLGAVEAGAGPSSLSPAPRGPGCSFASVLAPGPATGNALLGLPLLLLSCLKHRRSGCRFRQGASSRGCGSRRQSRWSRASPASARSYQASARSSPCRVGALAGAAPPFFLPTGESAVSRRKVRAVCRHRDLKPDKVTPE